MHTPRLLVLAPSAPIELTLRSGEAAAAEWVDGERQTWRLSLGCTERAGVMVVAAQVRVSDRWGQTTGQWRPNLIIPTDAPGLAVLTPEPGPQLKVEMPWPGEPDEPVQGFDPAAWRFRFQLAPVQGPSAAVPPSEELGLL